MAVAAGRLDEVQELRFVGQEDFIILNTHLQTQSSEFCTLCLDSFGFYLNYCIIIFQLEFPHDILAMLFLMPPSNPP